MGAGRSPAEKGRKAEAEVRDLWRRNGWPRARRQPGSGSWRPYGPRDQSPMPLDVGGVDPFMVSVKRDRKLAVPQRGTGIPGGGFARRALLEAERLSHGRPVGSEPRVPILFGRPGMGEGSNGWRVWAPEDLVLDRIGGSVVWGGEYLARVEAGAIDFVELPWWAFFPLIGTEDDWRETA